MFAVSSVSRLADPAGAGFIPCWPVVFENLEHGVSSEPVARPLDRDTAQIIADELNAVLTAHGGSL